MRGFVSVCAEACLFTWSWLGYQGFCWAGISFWLVSSALSLRGGSAGTDMKLKFRCRNLSWCLTSHSYSQSQSYRMIMSAFGDCEKR